MSAAAESAGMAAEGDDDREAWAFAAAARIVRGEDDEQEGEAFVADARAACLSLLAALVDERCGARP